MKFLYPQFLYALALVAIPIIIHLFNFRKFKTVYFSNVQFLKAVKEKTKSQSQLKHLLILLSRILAIAALVFAFAQAYIPVNDNKQQAKKHAVSIYIDNSFSMDGENENGRLLLTAKQQAQAIIDAYSKTDELYILDNDFKAIHQRALSKELFNKEVNALESSSKTHTLNQIYKRQKNTLESSNADQKDIYIISDFQNSITDLAIDSEDSAYSIRFIPLNAYQNTNLYVDSCWLNTPNPQRQNNIKLFAKIKNSTSSEKREVNVKLEINQQQKAIANTEFYDESTIEMNFNVQEDGWHNAVLSIQDYPITFDDKYYFSFEVKPKLNVQHIFHDEAHPSIEKLFAKDEYFDFSTQNINQLNYSSLLQNQLLVLSGIKTLSSGLQQSLKSAIESGSTVLIFPSSSLDIANFRTFAKLMNIGAYQSLIEESTSITSLDKEHQLFEGVFEEFDERINFPIVNQYFNLEYSSKNAASPIMNLENSKSFFNEYTLGKGKLYLSSVGLDDTFGSLSKHALFVPLLYNIASYSGGKQALSYKIGEENIPFRNTKLKSPLTLSNADIEFIPESRGNGLWVSDQIAQAGHYELKDNEQTTLAFLSFNYDRMESDISVMDTEQLKSLSNTQNNVFLLEKELSNLSRYLEQLNTGIPLWIYCIILAIFLLVVETLLIRLL